jgi:hypothetical protein
MLSNLGNKGTANQNNIEIPPHSSQNGYHQTQTTANAAEDVGKSEPYPLLVGMQPLWKTVWRVLKKLKLGLTYDPAIQFLSKYMKECKPGYNRATCTPMFITALFTIAMLWKKPRCPTTDKWIKKMW